MITLYYHANERNYRVSRSSAKGKYKGIIRVVESYRYSLCAPWFETPDSKIMKRLTKAYEAAEKILK